MPAKTDTLHPHHDKLVDASGHPRYTNALASETSPYLLQHAHNPVDWQAWGEAAFDKARAEAKPILLSVGYSTCYWCHVMERQVFESPELAEPLNQTCVAIKVDREERPDVDELYMTATQLLTGHGGWPMNVFLTPPGANGHDDPGLKPFWAGTYLPPESMHGMASFPQIIQAIGDAWQNRRQEVLDQAERVTQAVREHLAGSAEPGNVDASLVQRVANHLMQQYDATHGGFGGAPKFPQPATLQFLIAVHDNNDNTNVRQAIEHTLRCMAHGGIFDQVGGGFHRYSTDAQWLVPHFEKMLYDNGQLLETYARAFSRMDESALRRQYDRTIRETADYVLREMVDSTGAFYSAQDAEVEGREGANYLWTKELISEALEDEALQSRALAMYGLDQGTNFRDPHDPQAEPANVLFMPESLDAITDEADESIEQAEATRRRINEQLLAVRNRRPQPRTDDKVLVAWNGLMIAGLARAGAALDEPRYVEAATHAAQAIARHLQRPDGSLFRTMRDGRAAIDGQLEDYALLAHGLIELARATGDSAWRERAQTLIERASGIFEAEQGGYYDTLAEQHDLLVRLHSAIDGSMPSGNSQMVHNLLDLYELTGESAYLDRACDDLRRYARPLAEQGRAMPHMAHALLRALEVAPQHLAARSSSDQAADAHSTDEEPVRVHVDRTTIDLSQQTDTLRVTLQPATGYHINAHEPGDAALQPLSVELVDGEALTMSVDYPAGEPKQYPFADGSIYVHESTLAIAARIAQTGTLSNEAQPQLLVRYQPCSEHTCLEPRTHTVALRVTGYESSFQRE